MREIRRETLQAEISRLGTLVVQAWLYHPCGVLLHGPGDSLNAERVAALEAAEVASVMAAEPLEERSRVLAALGVVVSPIEGVSRMDAVAEDVVAGSRVLVKAGTSLEPELVAALAREKIANVPVCATATLTAVAQARRYLDALPVTAKAIRPEPAGAIPTSFAWSLLTPRAKVILVIPDDMVRLRLLNGFVAAGHEAVAASDGDIAEVVSKERPDAVLTSPETALRVCGALRKKGEIARSMAIAIAADSAKIGGLTLKALEAGANDVVPLPATPAQLADRARSWLRLRNKIVGLPPVVAKERRKSERSLTSMTLRLSDPASGRALPVASATLLDFSDGGLRLEYGLLEPPDPGQYRPHAVHPKHALFAYAKDNPMGRDFLIELTGKGVPPFEAHGRFTHVSLVTGSERAGVAFIRRQDGAAERVTTIYRKPPR